ncbi:hypothetical protein N7456_010226 [Penicillium angulare]|uniref:Uncharacterized protein n=1 Tax=Penicillium angulare TaxID=116970 RepID=A0A9W9K6A2_9EURO|nr:hypothetical protein N7456_010226 [Penicillium angulare]
MASVENQFVFDASTQPEEWVDFDQSLDLEPSYSDDYSASVNSISPDMTMPYDTDIFTNDLPDLTQPGFPEMNYDLSQQGFFADQSPSFESLHDPTPVFDDAMFAAYPTYDNTYDFRQMVEAQAASDPRVASIKEKRREAAIALHLQRLCDATALDLDMSSDSNTSFSSPCWSDYMRESISPQPATSSPEQASAALPSGTGGLEMVLDLNMNAAANLPKKQKPRSQAQKENYIKARKYGACEKHKKQHKRCNCLEKAAALAGANEVPMDITYKDRVKQPMAKLPQVPSPRALNVPGPHILETQLGARPSASVAKRIVTTSVNDSSARSTIARPDVQLFTKSATKLTRSSAGHDQQTSTSFVLSPNPDYNKRTNNSPGRAPSLNVSTGSTLETNRKNVGLPTYRGCSLGKSSANRPTDAFTRQVATMQTMAKKSIYMPSNAERRDPCTHCASSGQSPATRQSGSSAILRPGVTYTAQSPVYGDVVVKQTNPSGTNAQNRGLEVYHSRTLLLSSTAKSRSLVLTSHDHISPTGDARAEVKSWPQRVLEAIDQSAPQGLQRLRQMMRSIANSLDISLHDRYRYPASSDKSNVAHPTSRDRQLRRGEGFLSAMSTLAQVFSVLLGSFVSMATFWQLSSSRPSWPRCSDRLLSPSLSGFLGGSTLMSASKRLSIFPQGKLMSCMVR